MLQRERQLLGSLLVLVGFVYVYVVFLLFELGRSGRPSVVGLALGLVSLLLLLFGLGRVLMGGNVPGWLSSVWDQLLKER